MNSFEQCDEQKKAFIKDICSKFKTPLSSIDISFLELGFDYGYFKGWHNAKTESLNEIIGEEE